MIRFQRVALAVSLLTVVAAVGTASAGEQPMDRPAAVTVGMVAEQLGVRVATDVEKEFGVGIQFTGTLEDSTKLEKFGMPGFHAGARVTVIRLSVDRVLVEADELDPPKRKSVKISMSANGGLIAPPKV